MSDEVGAIVARLLRDALDDWVGLWELPSIVADGRALGQEALLTRALAVALREGWLVAGELSAGGFSPWPGPSEEALRRVEAEWRASLPEGPRLLQVACWFDLTAAGERRVRSLRE